MTGRWRAFVTLVSALSCGAAAWPAEAQDNLPPIELYRVMLESAAADGWVAFRDFDGHQWVYFTPLVVLHCRVHEIRYSVNSTMLDLRFPVPACNPTVPFSLPPDAGPETVAIVLEQGAAHSVSVQVVLDDGFESGVLSFAPCPDVGEQSCAMRVEEQ